MSIHQIQSGHRLPHPASSLQTPATKGTPASSFTTAIEIATHKRDNLKPGEAVHAATAAAELLNLEMMKSALSLGGDTSAPSFAPFTIPLSYAMPQPPAESQKIDTPVTAPPSQVEPKSVGPRIQRSAENVQDIVNRASERYGVDSALIKAVIKAESNFNPSAVSHAGAQGLMQLMPATARGLGVHDSFNPEQNVMAGTRFLKDMINRYHGNVDSALAAYNWGPGNVDRKGTSSLPQETREYLAKVKSYYNQYVG